MKRLDKLIIIEILGPWLFGIAIFTVLVTAGSFLFELTRYISEGVAAVDVLLLLIYLLPGVIAKTFSMAMLLAALLAFGRLSGESEITAIRAAGVSLGRVMRPVAAFGIAVALLAFVFGNYLVPVASVKAIQLRAKIEQDRSGRDRQEVQRYVMDDGRIQMAVNAKDFDVAERTLTDVSILLYDKDEEVWARFDCEQLIYNGDTDWRVVGKGTLRSDDGTLVEVNDAFPVGVDNPEMTPEDLIAQNLRDLDAFSMEQLNNQVQRQLDQPEPDLKQVQNLRFGYYNKIAVPMAAFVFGLLGAPLGIRNHRTGVASGFWISIIIIFAYMMLTNALSIMAQGGAAPPWAASFIPVLIGVIAAAYFIKRRNN